jgi:hypothetical protein
MANGTRAKTKAASIGMNRVSPLDIGMNGGCPHRVICESADLVIGKCRQLAISRWQMAQSKNESSIDWDESCKSFRYWDEAIG